jgi:hypothetical protein
MCAPMFEQVKKSGICKTGSVLKGLITFIEASSQNWETKVNLSPLPETARRRLKCTTVLVYFVFSGKLGTVAKVCEAKINLNYLVSLQTANRPCWIGYKLIETCTTDDIIISIITNWTSESANIIQSITEDDFTLQIPWIQKNTKSLNPTISNLRFSIVLKDTWTITIHYRLI